MFLLVTGGAPGPPQRSPTGAGHASAHGPTMTGSGCPRGGGDNPVLRRVQPSQPHWRCVARLVCCRRASFHQPISSWSTRHLESVLDVAFGPEPHPKTLLCSVDTMLMAQQWPSIDPAARLLRLRLRLRLRRVAGAAQKLRQHRRETD